MIGSEYSLRDPSLLTQSRSRSRNTDSVTVVTRISSTGFPIGLLTPPQGIRSLGSKWGCIGFPIGLNSSVHESTTDGLAAWVF